MKKEIQRQNNDWRIPDDQIGTEVPVSKNPYDYNSKKCVENLNKYVQELKAFIDTVRKAKADATRLALKPVKKTGPSPNTRVAQMPNMKPPFDPSKSHRC